MDGKYPEFFLSLLFDFSLCSIFSNVQGTKSITYFHNPMNVMYMSKTKSGQVRTGKAVA